MSAPDRSAAFQQEAAQRAVEDWIIEAYKRGVHEDDLRDSFEKALDWARGEYGEQS